MIGVQLPAGPPTKMAITFGKTTTKTELASIRRQNRKIKRIADEALKAELQASQMAGVGYPAELIHEETGVSADIAQTLLEKKAALKPIADAARELLADKCYALALQALETVNAESFANANLVQISTFAGTVLDKALLLSGKPTEIVLQYKQVIEKYMKRPDVIDVTPQRQ